jgi:hypothetical protein
METKMMVNTETANSKGGPEVQDGARDGAGAGVGTGTGAEAGVPVIKGETERKTRRADSREYAATRLFSQQTSL